jgi:Ser/Thr protein kinase RdoA (MazF antagonist)
LSGLLDPLEGERDQNFRLHTDDGQLYVVKISGDDEDREVVAFQTGALLHIQSSNPELGVPRIKKTVNGDCYAKIGSDSNLFRVLTYLTGIPMSCGQAGSAELASNAGIFLGRIATSLLDYSHSRENYFMPWNMINGLLDEDGIWASGGEDMRALESELRPRCRQTVAALLQQRMQVVHNDAHQDNLLIEKPDSNQVTGMIDFGDLVRTALVCDLAILCLAFAETSSTAELSVANVVAGYHSEYPLLEQEIDLVYEAMLTRETLAVLLYDFKIAHDASASKLVHETRPDLMEGLLRLREIGADAFRDAIFDSCKL